MLQAEIEEEGRVNLRQKGVMHKSGRIFKGVIVDAGSKCSIGSIPSAYQGIIYRSTSSQAFGSGCQRFELGTQELSTASSLYDLNTNASKSKSFNQKGGGTLLSKVARQVFVPKQGPSAPTQAKDPKSMSTEARQIVHLNRQKKTYAKGTLKENIVERFRSKDNLIPGPGSYNATSQSRVTGCVSPFQSKMPRINYYQKSTNPGPGEYQHEPHQKTLKRRTKSPQKVDYNQLVLKYYNSHSKPLEPGNSEPDFKPKYLSLRNSPVFVHNGRDRFGKAEQDPNDKHPCQAGSVGPGAYELQNAFRGQKEFVSTSPFLDNTVREIFEDSNWKFGPSSCGSQLGHKEFNLNIDRKWI